jgi:hypothetical protein
LTIEASFRQEYFASTIVKKGNKTVQNILKALYLSCQTRKYQKVAETNGGATSWLIEGVDFTSPSSIPVDSSS